MSKETGKYETLLGEIKTAIQHARKRAAFAVNAEMILLYWQTGKMISERQKQQGWSAKVIPRLAADLQNEFTDLKGFSERNLGYMVRFAQEYSENSILQQAVAKLHVKVNETNTNLPQLVANLPWGHNILLMEKVKDREIRFWYMQQTIENGWSREALARQIKSDLFGRQGKAVSNFNITLPAIQSALVQQTLKDPYVFDFLTLDTEYRERDIENQLIAHVNKFLLELGKGFAYVGQQYHLAVGETDYYIDLLFYHIRLKCYVVIELKNTRFIPEYAGKLNFYLSAVDSLLKQDDDKPTIGILLCKSKNNIEAEFALRDINKPMGVSGFEITNKLPENLKSSLPTIEEIENELNKEA